MECRQFRRPLQGEDLWGEGRVSLSEQAGWPQIGRWIEAMRTPVSEPMWDTHCDPNISGGGFEGHQSPASAVGDFEPLKFWCKCSCDLNCIYESSEAWGPLGQQHEEAGGVMPMSEMQRWQVKGLKLPSQGSTVNEQGNMYPIPHHLDPKGRSLECFGFKQNSQLKQLK